MRPLILTTQRVDIVRGERRDALDQAWTTLADRFGWQLFPVPNRTPDPARLIRDLRPKGVLLTGGNDIAVLPDANEPAPERDATEAALLDAAGADIPVLGVCRGMQMLVHHYGGRLHRCPDHIKVHHPISLAPEAGFVTDGGEVNSYHSWCIAPDGLPNELEAIATAPDGTIEAVRHRSLPRMGILWHPERDGRPTPFDETILRRAFETAK